MTATRTFCHGVRLSAPCWTVRPVWSRGRLAVSGADRSPDLGEHGAEVVVNYRSSEGAAHDVVETIEESGGTAIAAQGDVSEYEDMEALCEQVHDAFGPLDVLVNNAGITVDKKFDNMTKEDWDAVIDVNLGGVFNATHCFWDDIKRADAGRLINVSSVVGQQGNYGQANYATTKSGLFGFTRTLALELASTGSTANCIAPGFVATDMLEEVPKRVQRRFSGASRWTGSPPSTTSRRSSGSWPAKIRVT